MPSAASVRVLNAGDLAAAAALGINQASALRAIAQDLAWVFDDGRRISGAATAYLADGTVFLDGLVGHQEVQRALLNHAIAYAKWSYAPALTLLAAGETSMFDDLGFVGVDQHRLPPDLAKVMQQPASTHQKILMKRL